MGVLVRLLVFSTAASATVSCASSLEPELAALLQDARAAEARWTAGRPVHYEMVERISCECPSEVAGPVRLEVTLGEGASAGVETIVAATYTRDAEPVSSEYLHNFLSVQELFRLIHDAARAGADAIEADFDPVLGYPTRLFIDYDRDTADEELMYRVEELRSRDQG